jgi:hypothetical protein
MGYLKDRFEIFKRDEFKCQYCGRTPPEVVLELDHVIPKSKGGKNDINNYLTSCFECNRGKKDNQLDNIPPSLVTNIAAIKEKRVQIKKYNDYLNEIQTSKLEAFNQLDEIYNSYFPEYVLSDNFKFNTLNTLIQHLPLIKLKEAMHMACSKLKGQDNRAIKYFCGICWNWIKNPETRDW